MHEILLQLHHLMVNRLWTQTRVRVGCICEIVDLCAFAFDLWAVRAVLCKLEFKLSR